MYELRVLSTKTGKSPKDGRDFAVVEYEVTGAAEGSSLRVGDKRSHLIMMSGLTWQGDIKAMVAAINAIHPDDVDEKGTEMFFGAAQPATGKTVQCKVWNKPTRKGGVFTAVRYSNPAVDRT